MKQDNSSSIDHFFRGVFKYIDRQITGQTEIQRLAHQGNIFALEQSISLSKTLHTYKQKYCHYSAPFTSQMVDELCQLKNIVEEQNKDKVTMMVVVLHSWKYAVNVLQQVRKTEYCREEKQHEEMLMEVWRELRPGRRLKNRKSQEWIELGFQGRDPATDFRGAGVLGLVNLRKWVGKEGGKEAFRVADSPGSQYFFASASLFLTMLALQLVKEAIVPPYFWVLPERDGYESRGGERESEKQKEEGDNEKNNSGQKRQRERVLGLFQLLFEEIWWQFGSWWLQVRDKSMMQFNCNLLEFSRRMKEGGGSQVGQRLVVRKDSLLSR